MAKIALSCSVGTDLQGNLRAYCMYHFAQSGSEKPEAKFSLPSSLQGCPRGKPANQ